MNVGIIGLGLIGKKRHLALHLLKERYGGIENIYLYDPNVYTGNVINSVEEMAQQDLGMLIIATPHDVSLEILKHFEDKNIKILIEKPFGKWYFESNRAYSRLKYPQNVYVGFNYRFFDGIQNIIEDYDNNMFGNLYGINIELGHGGSPKDKDTWKSDPKKVGEYSLLDPGIHALDLLYLIDNSVKPICVTRSNTDSKIAEEMNVILVGDKVGTVNLQVSLARWKNVFKFQINGEKYMGTVNGRGNNYGEQRYTTLKKWAWLDKESENLVCTTDCEDSFYKELESIIYGKQYYLNPCTAREALNVMRLYSDCIINLEGYNKDE